MFQLVDIELFNFRSYAGVHKFEFPAQSGLYNLTGKNLVNPRLGANGSGKSTLLEAVYWCLYGRTSRGLKAGAIITRGQSSAYVKLRLTVGVDTVVITRKQSPNALELDGVPVDQEAIQKFVRLTPDAFMHSAMFTQFGESFFDLSPSNKLTLFSNIMELDYWLERSNAAASLSNELTAEIQALDRQLAEHDAQIRVIETDLINLKQLEASHEAEQADLAKRAKAELAQAKKEQVAHAEALKTAKQALAEAEARVQRSEKAIKQHQSALDTLNEARTIKLATKAKLEASLDAIRASLVSLRGVKGACPACGQKITGTHLKTESARLAQIEEAARGELATIEQDRALIEGKVKQQRSSYNDEYIVLTTLRRNCIDFREEVSRCERGLESVGARVDVLSSARRSSPPTNPFAGQIRTKESRVGSLRSKAKACSQQLEEARADTAAVSYWIKGFKQIRLMVIDQTLEQLELEVNNNLTTLGLADWRVEFDVERENKSGGVTKGFTVLIYAPDTSEPVPWEAWSGGETQRLRLAGDLGLANLIMNRAGLTNSIEFYDEPSTHLSEEGLLDLTEALHERAQQTNKVILLVDHHALSFGQFRKQFVAVRDVNGSTLSVVE